jgi:Zn-dependent M16 (insulinase) family peptidase
MKLELNKEYHGFRLVREKFIREINSKGRIFHHERSGARLLHLENDDDNMVFAISFRTPPSDSTGIPHILEHSVLCGSEKFPTKEPFVELVKGSLNTFLNAMTFPDKTMYPVASRNRMDFMNLMNVYLDAVFHPNIHNYPEILMQEGWHHELEREEGEIRYKGVVYNEMKGVYSSPEAILFRNVLKSLFPDTCYGLESGGDPDIIPQLTREKFLTFHRTYYHPSNGYIYIYGNGDILEQLEFIQSEYLHGFKRIGVESSIPIQKPFARRQEVETTYPLAPGEDEGDKSYISLNFVTGVAQDSELYLAMNILEYLLLETPAAPLKKALIDAEVGKDVFGQFESSILQPVFSIIVKNSSVQKKQLFEEVVGKTLRTLVGEGIDKKLVEASININEFRLREADFRGLPKGLVYCMECMDSWLYDADPFQHLEYEPTLKKIKKALTDSYFEKLIDTELLNNTHSSLVLVNPEKGLNEKKDISTREKLASYKRGLSQEELTRLVQQTSSLKKRQATPDPPELVEKIPMLSLKDLDPRAEELPLQIRKVAGSTMLFHPIFTSKIAYVNLYFDINVPERDLPYVSLLSAILGKVGTKRYDYGDLSNEINIHTGGIAYRPETFGDKDDDSRYSPKFMIRSKALVSKLPKLCDLLGEILGTSRFEETKRLKEIVQETRSRIEMSIHEGGHLIAMSRLCAYFSPIGSFMERMSGLSFYRFISDLEKNFSARSEELVSTLKRIAFSIFANSALQMSLTTEESDYGRFVESFPLILDRIGNTPSIHEQYNPAFLEKNEGLLTPGKVQYVAKGFNFRRLGFGFSGTLLVLRTIASMDYLWNRVRVQGGAYGSFARFSRNGNMIFCSYRDPNLKETLAVYDTASEYLRAFNVGEREMTKYIIGTISKLDAPLTPSMKGEVSTERYFTSISQDDVQKMRDEVLRTRKKHVVSLADMVGDVMKQNYFCVIGNEEKLREHGDIFTRLVPVFED